ncbi:MAG: hypothetical protein NWT08_13080 [Akkermansiaceae bacterium]|jgi:hypothetical protein|nr:hypothetical protein [Akkermansiaceae bacterium]MDP4647716.1 hypothetical protein [Akkermansiaceae bacterium]MDP4722223.1 hypothetical protein [Akkermansiaceae bacterium]MDP4780264.1 hypothetical protein [Akkermansiaceae bacterium]MDP4846253.1 hypothetical protein [Akkermansiaceae bacterium]
MQDFIYRGVGGVGLVIALSFSLLAFGNAAESRIWTSRQGTTIEAELLAADASSATLVTKEAKQIKLDIEDLSLADRQYLVEYSGADPSILSTGDLGEPETQARIDSKTINKIDDQSFLLDDEFETMFDLTESEHFIIATAGDVKGDAVAETAERLWHGMSFQHMNFRRDWADTKMVIFAVENREIYTQLGKWYEGKLAAQGDNTRLENFKFSWDKVGSTSIIISPEMSDKYVLQPRAVVFNVTRTERFKKPMRPFQIYCISGALLSKQMGGVTSFGGKGYFALVTGHSYYKEISLGGESETQLLSPTEPGVDDFSSARGFDDGSSWPRELKKAIRKGTVEVELEPMLEWTAEGLEPAQLVLLYSFASYMQSTPKRLNAYATMIRRIESSNQIPLPVEIAKIFGFDSVEALNADWKEYVTSNDFR